MLHDRKDSFLLNLSNKKCPRPVLAKPVSLISVQKEILVVSKELIFRLGWPIWNINEEDDDKRR